MTKEEIIDAFNFRHACKVFDATKKIAKEDFLTILEVARLSPSSFGFEPWRFLVVESEQLREKLLPLTWGAQQTLPTASEYVIILARKKPTMLYNSDYITHMMYDIHKIPKEKAEARRQKYKTFQESDFKLTQNPRVMFEWACRQSYIALGNMMSVAAMLGIDSCAIEGFNMVQLEELMQKEFGVDTEIWGVSVMVAFGYRIKQQPKKTRQPLEDIVEWYR